MGQFNEHETEIDLMDDATDINDELEFEDRGDELTPEQLEAWNDENDEELELEDEYVDSDDADSEDDSTESEADSEDSAGDDDASGNDDPAADADAEEASRGSRMVPHGRFHEVNEQLKKERADRLRLEEELARARGTQQASQAADQSPEDDAAADAEPFDFDEAEDRYAEAIYDGDRDAARQIRAEIRAEEKKAAEAAAMAVVEQREAQARQARQQEQLQGTISKAYEQYPFLNPQDAGVNQDAIDEVVALRNVYLQRGDSPAVAISKAVDKVGPRYGKPANSSQPDETLTQQKKREAIERNQDRAGRIPPTGNGTGERARKVDYSALSDDEFENLPESEKKKARGDYL